MFYIPVKHLKPGMILARDIPGDRIFFSLLRRGQPLTSSIIARIEQRGVQGAYIKSSFSKDLTLDEFITPQLQQATVATIRKQFDDYIMHSFTPKLFDSMSGVASTLVSSVMTKGELMLNMIDIRDYDNYTYSHSMYVALISVLIGTQLNFTETQLREIAMCGLLHDIGKLDVPIEIVTKPCKLTNEETARMRTHPTNAVLRLKKFYSFPFMIINGIESHHEKYNGTGYPNRLSGNSIPLYGRILALADVYDALLSKRPYRSAWTPSQTVEYMMSLGNTHFDHELLFRFLRVVSCYPVGSLVKMSNGFLAVVIKNTPGQMLRPTVRILSPPEYRNLQIDLSDDRQFLSTTIVSTIQDYNQLPEDLFETGDQNSGK